MIKLPSIKHSIISSQLNRSLILSFTIILIILNQIHVIECESGPPPDSMTISPPSISSSISSCIEQQQQQQQKHCTLCDSTCSQQPSPPQTVPVHSNDVNTAVPDNKCQLQVIKSNNDLQPIQSTITTYDFDCEQLNFCDDRLGFEAILQIHRQLDEDANGDIDITESDEFIRDGLQYKNGDDKRQKAFHGNDKHITVDELWSTWHRSLVHNWTNDQTIEWLNEIVELPKYSNAFKMHGINGQTLPRLASAASNQQLFTILGINNPINKQKIALKAMDVVLFGEPKLKTIKNDLIIAALTLFATLVGYYAYRQNKYSKEHIRKMTKDIETLSAYEKQIESMENELNKLKKENEETSKEKEEMERKLRENAYRFDNLDPLITNNGGGGSCCSNDFDYLLIAQLEKELLETKQELQRLQLANENRQWVPPLGLQLYLQLTYEIENRNYHIKKANAELQLQAAREGCDKLKRKRSSLLGAFRIAHGSQIDYVDNTIMQARTLLGELTEEVNERLKRWKQIEAYCGFDIIHNCGLAQLEKKLNIKAGMYSGNITNAAAAGVSTASNVNNQILQHPLKSSTSSASMSKLLRRGSEATISEDDTCSIISAQPKATHFDTIHQRKQAAYVLENWQSYNLKKPSMPSVYQMNHPLNDINEDFDNNNCQTIIKQQLPTTNRKKSLQSINEQTFECDPVIRDHQPQQINPIQSNQSFINDGDHHQQQRIQSANSTSFHNSSNSNNTFDTSSLTSLNHHQQQQQRHNYSNNHHINNNHSYIIDSNDELLSSDSNDSTTMNSMTSNSNVNFTLSSPVINNRTINDSIIDDDADLNGSFSSINGSGGGGVVNGSIQSNQVEPSDTMSNGSDSSKSKKSKTKRKLFSRWNARKKS